MAALAGGDPWLAAAYPVIARAPLPDGSEGMVRMRRPSRSTDDARGATRSGCGAAWPRCSPTSSTMCQGLRVTVDYRDDALAAGSVAAVTVEAQSALVGEFAGGRPAAAHRAGPPAPP